MLQPNFNPFPQLTTERLLLRKVIFEDAPEIFFLRSDKQILQFLSKEPARSLQEAEEFIVRITNDLNNGDGIAWGITFSENPKKLLGTIGFWRMQKEHYRAEIGYVLHPSFWKKGIMKEAVCKALEYGFSEMGLHSVEARINPNNTGSASVLESTGFIREAYFKEDFFFKGKFEDTAVYSLLNKLP